MIKKLTNSVLIPIIFLSSIFSQVASAPAAVADFTDVNEGHSHYIAIKYLNENGIIDGYSDGTFKPNDEINRAEALKMITLANGLFNEEDLDLPDPDDTPRPFTDTPINEWYTKYLIAAKDAEVIHGYEDGTFEPGKNINLAESLKILLESSENINYIVNPEDHLYADTPLNDWFTKYTAYAHSQDWLIVQLDNMAHPEQEVTRGYLAEIIYRKVKYKEQYLFGKATFYGAAVQGNGTASGETFDMYKFTAAHKTLPFGTYVDVTNLANGKTIQVKINDRGPYGAGRAIDLSSSAFSEIASLSTGVINVQYKIVIPDNS